MKGLFGAQSAHHMILEASLDKFLHPILIVKSNGRILFANKAAENMLVCEPWIDTKDQCLTLINRDKNRELDAALKQATRGIDLSFRNGHVISILSHSTTGKLNASIFVTPLGTTYNKPIGFSSEEPAAIVAIKIQRKSPNGFDHSALGEAFFLQKSN